MANTIIEDTFGKIDLTLATYINDVATSVIISITPVVTTLLLIYMALWGWLVITGKTGEIVTDGFNRIIKITLVVAIAINLGYYNTFVVNLLSNLPDHLASLASITPVAGTGVFLDEVLSDIWKIGWLFANKAMANSSFIGVADVPLTLAALAVWILGVVLIVFAAFLLILSKMALSVLLGVGPIFILLIMFEPTKRFFESWLGQCINYIFIVMLTGGILRLIIAVLNSYLTSYQASVTPATVEVEGALPAVMLSAIAILILKQVMPMASALGGGIALSSLGAGRSIGQAASNWDSRRMQSKMHKGQSVSSAGQLKGAYNASKNAAKWATDKLKRGNSVTNKS